jgi:hypothetical protein
VGVAVSDAGAEHVLRDGAPDPAPLVCTLPPDGRSRVVWRVRLEDAGGRPRAGVAVRFAVTPMRPLDEWRSPDDLAPRFRAAEPEARAAMASGDIRLVGDFADATAHTDADGVAVGTYRVSDVAGPQEEIAVERLEAIALGHRAEVRVEIGWADLANIEPVDGGLRLVTLRRHAHRDVVAWLTSLGQAVAALDWPRPVSITSASFRWGGLYPPHLSHRRGGHLDIRLMSHDGQPTWCRPDGACAPNYDRPRTIALVGMLASSRPTELYFNDPHARQAGAVPRPGHDNHLHVSWELPGYVVRTPAPITTVGR